MSTRPVGNDFLVPDGFVDDVMRRVAIAPRPMPVRSFWSALVDRSAMDVVGSIAVAWRLVQHGGTVPRMIRAQALALVVLLAVSVGGTSVFAAAAAYRTVAPVVFPPKSPFSLGAPVPSDEPDVIPRATPYVAIEHDQPDVTRAPGTAEPVPASGPGSPVTAKAPPTDPSHHAMGDDDDRDHEDGHAGDGGKDEDEAEDGDHGGTGDEDDGDAGGGEEHGSPSDDGGDDLDGGEVHDGGDSEDDGASGSDGSGDSGGD